MGTALVNVCRDRQTSVVRNAEMEGCARSLSRIRLASFRCSIQVQVLIRPVGEQDDHGEIKIAVCTGSLLQL